MTEDMAVIHFEKGLSDYKGVYQAINKVFLERSCPDFKWVNREQDMGVEGVRKAKQSYNPARFLKKYLAKWKGKSRCPSGDWSILWSTRTSATAS